jgi:hypothetical protein
LYSTKKPVGRPAAPAKPDERRIMALSTIILIVLVLALLGAVPVWGYSRPWGYAPSGVVGLLLLIVVIALLLGWF